MRRDSRTLGLQSYRAAVDAHKWRLVQVMMYSADEPEAGNACGLFTALLKETSLHPGARTQMPTASNVGEGMLI